MIQYRRNINCLTSNQLHDLREALAILYSLPQSSPNSWLHVAGLHGEPSPAWCIHGAPGFATWHRAYLLALEGALHCLNPDVTVPFWDWSSSETTGLPPACSSEAYINRSGDSLPNPLYAGPLPPGGPGAMTERRSDIDTTSFGDLATTAQNAMGNPDFVSFQNALNSVHGSVHGRIGGDMGSVPYAAFDPIFWLHHANVDRLWAAWQAGHPGALPADESSLTLEPFLEPCTTSSYVGSDMLSTEALGYRYTRFCLVFVGIFDLKPIRLRIEPRWRERLDVAKLVIRTRQMQRDTFDLRVFVNEPGAGPGTGIEDNSSYAGSFGVFGMTPIPRSSKKKSKTKGARKSHDAMPMGMPMEMRGEDFDMQLDVTEALRKALTRRSAPILTLVAVDPNGKRVPRARLDFRSIELHVR